MYRVVTALALSLACTAAAPAADRNITLRWHGQSFFEVVSPQGVRVVLDPHAIAQYGKVSVQADLILMSHFHTDHTQFGVIENYRKARLVTGLKDEKGDGKHVEWNAVDLKLKDVHVELVGTYHDRMNGMQRGKNGVFILEIDGIRIVHLGDLGHLLSPAQVKSIGPVDVLLIPVGGVYTINGSDAKEVVAQLKPLRWIVPMHCGTRVYDDLLPADEFLDEQKEELVKRFDTNELVIDPKSKPPAEPSIAVLNWEPKKEK